MQENDQATQESFSIYNRHRAIIQRVKDARRSDNKSAALQFILDDWEENQRLIEQADFSDTPTTTTTPARPASRPSRRIRKITEPKLDNIPGVRRGMSKEAA